MSEALDRRNKKISIEKENPLWWLLFLSPFLSTLVVEKKTTLILPIKGLIFDLIEALFSGILSLVFTIYVRG